MKKGAGKAINGRPAAAARGAFSLGELAALVGGAVSGDPKRVLTGVQPLDSATAGDLSWVAEERNVRTVSRSAAGALIVGKLEHASGRPAVIVANPTAALAAWLARWSPPPRPKVGVASGAFVHSRAKLGRGVSVAAGATVASGARVGARSGIGAGVFIGEGAVVGEDCVLFPNAVVLDGCILGNRCILYAGAVIGSDGFGYVWDGQQHRKIPQTGIVRLEDDVEVGANATVDRATFGETLVRRGTKIDNLVMIAHNVEVGEHSILCAQAGVAGSSRLGRGVTLAGQAGIGDHAVIGDRAMLTGQSGVPARGTVAPGAVLSGMPAAPHREFLRSAAVLQRLPELARRFEELARRVEALAKGGGPWNSESRKS